MNTPQLEDGYTRIANELLEAIFQANFNGSQIRVLLCLLRNTYGFNRKECEFSNGFISSVMGIDKKSAAAVVKSLVDGKVLQVMQTATFNSARKVSINKNYSEWECISPQWKKKPTGGDIPTTTGGDIPTTTGGDVPTHKRKNLKKEYKEIYEDFFETVWKSYPKKRGKESVSAKAKKELYDAGMDIVTAAIEKYKREAEGTDERYVLYGSTFFNSRWKDYIPDPVRGEIEIIKPSESKEEPPIDLWGGD